MGTLIENLNEIYSIKGDIRSAIEDKGVDMTGMSFPDYPTAIGQISGGGTFVTETLNVSVNNTYYPGQGVDGFSMVVVDVPQSVTGFTEKEVTEGVQITDLNNSAGYVHSFVFEKDTYLQTVNLPNCSIVNEQAFAYCTNLTTVSLPTCQTLGFSAFNACSNLINVYLPVCSAMSENAFNGCNKLQTIVCPELTSGSNVVFAYCSSLVSIDLPKLTKVGRSMFMNCWNLEQINLPVCSSVDYNGFYGCSKLTDISLPLCFRAESNAFNSCKSLRNVYLPNCSLISYYAFGNCSSLETVNLTHVLMLGAQMSSAAFSELSLPCISFFGTANMFQNCSNLTSLTLGTGTYMVPPYSNALNGTPFINGSGTIYVDAAMYDKWITSAGWSSFSSLFVSVGNTDPMVSYSDGVIYGKTMVLTERVTVEGVNVGPSLVTTLSLSKCDYVNTDACRFWGNLVSLYLPMCSVIRNGAFTGCGALSDMSLPQLTYIDDGAFKNCNALTSIYLPECKIILNNAFQEDHNLSILSLPKCEVIGSSAFQGTMQTMQDYVSINLPVCSYIGNQAFYWAEKLNSITLGSTSVCVLGGNQAFQTTNIYRGSIYVPASLVDAYKSARFWSQYSSRIFPIE